MSSIYKINVICIKGSSVIIYDSNSDVDNINKYIGKVNVLNDIILGK